ncbi:YcaO-like family protein [Bacteroides cellulosilyticus]|uniref:YcaO-like family protein n=1 Tax=Bacteroides cellulosilyticus TaxID=246787 RepID=UPI001C37AFF7|nr:YcaO-like family protein [Bacteroides cellulosilyticus]MBV3637235.1 YcaO-like family protein [Bacteroides cellulosilyticus]MBV3663561.1 YcaO-like family protein [Bacteroides cellulosilyticus]MBV3685682.1 YcaO-like family protein [Bacteroides cellulosilyticus]MBV3694195.1 YcaO-like family protein [Bacteroides cellulosilyticus]MBV3707836.1 YcaO-like family protein [Bacteroides cellulosilyticus]
MIKKPYKADTPAGTVNRIKNIIATHVLPVKEKSLGDGRDFFSCRIYLSHGEDSSIGTNGKGMNQEYALASGYAEFMERLQNRVIVYPNPANINSSCRFFPDEKTYELNHDDAIAVIKKYVPRVLSSAGLCSATLEGVSLPFYHVNSGRVQEVPYSLIRWINGSNGMCAGNIREEALIQGFCEIFERYCIQEMYKRKIVPPEVPRSAFDGTKVIERLENLRNIYGMDYSIKDYSLGEGFPVIGLLLYNKGKSKYILHLGADLNPEIALERCFTEIFQGYTADTLTFENDVNACERLDAFNEFKRSLMYGRGRQHDNFFTGLPSYSYLGHTTIPVGKNFREDLHNICQWLIKKGYDIYIRDNSYLGFPALHLVVPGLSEIDHTFCNLNRRVCHMQLTENRVNPLFRFRWLNDSECRETIEYLSQLDKEAIELFTRNNHPNNTVNRHIILMLLHVRLGHKEEAVECLETYKSYCLSQKREIRPYYEQMIHILRGEYVADKTADSYKIASSFLAHPEKALEAIDTPTCFNCERCHLSIGCLYPLLQEIEAACQTAMAEYMPSQDSLSELFQ